MQAVSHFGDGTRLHESNMSSVFRHEVAKLHDVALREKFTGLKYVVEKTLLSSGESRFPDRVIDLHSTLHKTGFVLPLLHHTDSSLFFPYIESGSLSDYFKEHPDMDQSEKLKIARLLLDFLVEIQRLGYAHGDLKPDNILYDGDKLYVIDLDTMQSVSNRTSDVFTEACTPAYAAPEWQRRSSELTLEADMFSYGIILGWIFGDCTTPPSASRTASETDARREYCIGRLRGETPNCVHDIIHGCMQHDPAKREALHKMRSMFRSPPPSWPSSCEVRKLSSCDDNSLFTPLPSSSESAHSDSDKIVHSVTIVCGVQFARKSEFIRDERSRLECDKVPHLFVSFGDGGSWSTDFITGSSTTAYCLVDEWTDFFRSTLYPLSPQPHERLLFFFTRCFHVAAQKGVALVFLISTRPDKRALDILKGAFRHAQCSIELVEKRSSERFSAAAVREKILHELRLHRYCGDTDHIYYPIEEWVLSETQPGTLQAKDTTLNALLLAVAQAVLVPENAFSGFSGTQAWNSDCAMAWRNDRKSVARSDTLTTPEDSGFEEIGRRDPIGSGAHTAAPRAGSLIRDGVCPGDAANDYSRLAHTPRLRFGLRPVCGHIVRESLREPSSNRVFLAATSLQQKMAPHHIGVINGLDGDSCTSLWEPSPMGSGSAFRDPPTVRLVPPSGSWLFYELRCCFTDDNDEANLTK